MKSMRTAGTRVLSGGSQHTGSVVSSFQFPTGRVHPTPVKWTLYFSSGNAAKEFLVGDLTGITPIGQSSFKREPVPAILGAL